MEPVLDLTRHASVHRYEHPTRIAERIHLRQPGDAFPHTTRISRHLVVVRHRPRLS